MLACGYRAWDQWGAADPHKQRYNKIKQKRERERGGERGRSIKNEVEKLTNCKGGKQSIR